MELETLGQFNKRLFKKFLGVYINKRRLQLNLSIEKVSELVCLSVKDIKSIESGIRALTQKQFELFCYLLKLDSAELNNMCKITQVNHIMGVYREIDEFFPR
ncbi:MAG: helix-turn-helix transcriptional regulator [Pseudobdellovibrio sp.]